MSIISTGYQSNNVSCVQLGVRSNRNLPFNLLFPDKALRKKCATS